MCWVEFLDSGWSLANGKHDVQLEAEPEQVLHKKGEVVRKSKKKSRRASKLG